MALFGERGLGPGDGEATTARPVMADHERAAFFDGLRMRKAPIGRAFDPFIERRIDRPGILQR
jgi:hypothetical protein